MAMLAGDPSRLRAVPTPAASPQFWLLGSSTFSAALAGRLGLPFSFAHHFAAANTEAALEVYRRSFRAVGRPGPAARDGGGQRRLRRHRRARPLPRRAGLAVLPAAAHRPARSPLPTPEEAAEHRFTPAEAAFLQERLAGQALGSPSTVRSQLTELLRRTGADELMVTSQIYDLADRLRSYELVAQLASTR